MVGFGGNDWYYVDNAGDKVYESVGGGNDRVFASVSYTLQAGSEVETLSTTFQGGTGAINLDRQRVQQHDLRQQRRQRPRRQGRRRFHGRLWRRTTWYYVDNSHDYVYESVGGGNDRVFASVSYRLQAGSEVETLSTTNQGGTGAINLTGNEFANTIYGNNGANVIDGKGRCRRHGRLCR